VRAALCLLALLPAAAADVAVQWDGVVLRGVTLDGPVVRQRGKEHPLDLFALVESEEGALLYAPDLAGRLRGYELLAAEAHRAGFARLLLEAIRIRHEPLARRLFARAQDAGMPGTEAQARLREIRQIAQAGARPAGADARARQIEEQIEALDRTLPDLLGARAARDGGKGPDGLRLLESALAASPPPEPALRLLSELAPKDFPLGEARVWLDWQIHLGSTGATFVPDGQKRLEYWRRWWRKDLCGVEAGPVMLLTPVRRGKLVARCMAYGRLVCDLLGTLFPPSPGAPTDPRPLCVLLYENKEEYARQTKEHSALEDPRFTEWTLGHYDPGLGVSRFFWYEDPSAERRVVGTCVHELTHHWLEQVGPFARRAPPSVPGYWIVEGFATFLEEGRHDPETGRSELFDPRAASLDALHSLARIEALIPWADLFRMSHERFGKLSMKEVRYTRRWYLGVEITRERRIFYEQAAAACHYLFHAEEGKHRQKLLDYVAAYYSGRLDRLDPKVAFGMDGAELGARIVRFAGEVARGWRPSSGTADRR